MRTVVAVCRSEPPSKLIVEELMKQKTKLDTPQFNLLCPCSIIKLQLGGDEWDHSSQLLHPINIVNNRLRHHRKDFLGSFVLDTLDTVYLRFSTELLGLFWNLAGI